MSFNTPSARRTPGSTQEQKDLRIDATRTGLMNFLQARRERLGQTAKDMMESPEAVWERQQQKIRAEQRKLVDDYMQTTASVDTL